MKKAHLHLHNSLHTVNTSSKKKQTVEIRRDSRAIEKPEHFAANILKTFVPKNFKFQLTEYTESHTGIVVNLPRNIKRYYCSIAKQFIKINSNNKCVYLGLLNSSFTKAFTV